jgi:penicillin V acylase-like amidase (Ntn superfamily)
MNLKDMTMALAALALSFCFFIQQAQACTTVALGVGTQKIIAKSFDWIDDHGLAFVNKRGVQKTALVLNHGDKPAQWISKFGSLTFSQYGREFPLDGMNEAGLVVEIMWLDSAAYGKTRTLPAVNELQWIQYQLDNFSTVAEVLPNLPMLRISRAYANVHFMICDKTGACATIEFLHGNPVVHSGNTLSVAALTNNVYAESLNFLKMFKGFGGSRPTPPGTGSLERFVRAALLLKKFSASPQDQAAAYAFRILKNVEQPGLSQWNIVYDPHSNRVTFHTLHHFKNKSVELSKLDFSCDTPAKDIDMNTEDQGDVTAKFADYSDKANLRLVHEGLDQMASRLPRGAARSIAIYPNSTRCL